MEWLYKLEEEHKKEMAYFYMTMCAFSFAVCSLAFKLLINIPSLQILIWRCVITCIFCYIFAQKFNIDYCIKDVTLNRNVILVTLLMTPASVFWFYGLRFMPMSESIVLNLVSPITAGLAGYVILKEPYTMKQIGFALIGLLGVILVSRPESLF